MSILPPDAKPGQVVGYDKDGKYAVMNDKPLPSQFQLDDKVELVQQTDSAFLPTRATVTGVVFRTGKVAYEVVHDDTGREDEVDSCDVRAAK